MVITKACVSHTSTHTHAHPSKHTHTHTHLDPLPPTVSSGLGCVVLISAAHWRKEKFIKEKEGRGETERELSVAFPRVIMAKSKNEDAANKSHDMKLGKNDDF